jgi:L-phenylalanine/L-methionine N-acetyltransferase
MTVSEPLDIVIRAALPSDLGAISAIYDQRMVAANTLQLPYTTPPEREHWVAPSSTHRGLVAEAEGIIVGNAGLTFYVRRRAHVGSFGMAVREEYQGRGVGTALMAAIIDLADNWHNLRRLELEVYADNAPAIRLYEKFGFVIEGLHRAYAFRLGEYVDVYTMARLRDDAPVVRDQPHGSDV